MDVNVVSVRLYRDARQTANRIFGRGAYPTEVELGKLEHVRQNI